ncbi:hypothetical protein V3C99_002170, partial [Haemonchus contortus]
MSQIDAAKTSLQALIEQMKESYDSTKSKEERKILLQDIEKIEEESHFNDVIKEATDLHFMLGTRLTEAISTGKRLERKLGIYGKTGPHTARPMNDIHEGPPGWDIENEAYRQPPFTAPSIAPPRVSVPVFTGREEEFPEFWAVYEQLVHNNPTLSTTEKMLLLKESLQGKSDKSIRGIQLIPQNYEWMIKTLHKKYGNKPANRARIVQQLNELPRASKTAESCEKVFDDICMLLNQMFSTGQNIRACRDALWTEAILNKFPKDIVEPVLLKMREHDDLTVDSILDFISGEISAKAYVQSRLRLYDHANQETANRKNNTPQFCAICETIGHFTWQCQSELSVSKKREIVALKRLCWKCYSPRHTSAQCSRNNCRLCGRMHHIKLCFTTESAIERGHSEQNTLSLSEEKQRGQRIFASETNKRASDTPGKLTYNTGSQPRKMHSANIHIQCDGKTYPEGVRGRCQLVYEEKTTEHHTNIECNTLTPKNEQIALMTAEGSIWNHDTQKFEKVIFFFDSGAQKTVIQEDLALRLKLPTLKAEACIMSGIGGKTETFQSNIVHVKIGTAYGKDLEILIQTKPILTNGFPAVQICSVDQQFLEKRNLLVCNPNIRGEHHIPDILVGLDHYHTFVLDSGEHLTTPSGLRIANTIFGPTLYGRGFTDISDGTLTTPSLSYNMTAIEETEREPLIKRSKNRAKRILQDPIISLNIGNEPSLTSSTLARASPNMSLLMVVLLISFANAYLTLFCRDQTIRILSPNGTFEGCIQTTCERFHAMPSDLSLQLPCTTTNNNISVSMRYTEQMLLKEFCITCSLPHICRTFKNIFSKHRRGDSHCWPITVLISVASIVYTFVSVPLLAVKNIQLPRKEHRVSGQMASTADCHTNIKRSSPCDRNTKTCALRRSSCTSKKIDFETFSPRCLSIIVAVTFALVMPYGQAAPCQREHMRHYAEIICNSSGRCSMEFSREILLNENRTGLELSGTLAYVPLLNETEIMAPHGRSWTAVSSWIPDISVPLLWRLNQALSIWHSRASRHRNMFYRINCYPLCTPNSVLMQ